MKNKDILRPNLSNQRGGGEGLPESAIFSYCQTCEKRSRYKQKYYNDNTLKINKLM